MRPPWFSPKLVTWALWTILLGGFMLVAQSGWAATITFADLTDNVQVLPVSARVTTTCLQENCTNVHVTAPSPVATIVNNTIDTPFYISEPDGLTVSDGVGSSLTIGNQVYDLSFLSDPVQELLGGPCGQGGNNCRFAEDGTPQLIGTVTWSEGTVDSIYVQSDIDAVPEPSSIILMTIGLAALVIRRTNPRRPSRISI